MSGANYSDVCYYIGISKPSFYRVIWVVIHAIVVCPQLSISFPRTQIECQNAANDFLRVSYGHAISNCVGAIDGILVEIRAPPAIVGNVRSYYSGHYRCYGVNVQAVCDAHSRFTFLAVSGPGSMSDSQAITETNCNRIIETLPTGYVVNNLAMVIVVSRCCHRITSGNQHGD